MIAAALLTGCSGSFPTRSTHYTSELSALRAERLDLEGRLATARMRRDTTRFNDSPFPGGSDGETAMLESRLSLLNDRIQNLEAEAAAANTSVTKQ